MSTMNYRTVMLIGFVLIGGALGGLAASLLQMQKQRQLAAVVEQQRKAEAVLAAEQAKKDALAAQRPVGEEWLTRFDLTERSGRTVTTEQLLGQPYVVSFFFTTCPSVCITQNQKLKMLQEEFKGQGVHFLSITCDPEVDDPKALQEYATRFGADPQQWLFLTGDLTYLRRVGAEMYQLGVDKKFHSEKFVLIDREGKIVGHYGWNDADQWKELREKIREQLANPA